MTYERDIVHIGAGVERELRDDLLALAQQHDRSFSAEVRRALRWYVLYQDGNLDAALRLRTQEAAE